MLQKEFEERTGKKVSPEQYAEIDRIYMAAGDVDKDTFCKEWKRLEGSTVVAELTREVELTTLQAQSFGRSLENEKEQKDALAKELEIATTNNRELAEEVAELKAIKTRLAEALLREGFDCVARDIFGASAVIGLKCSLEMELDADDRKFLAVVFKD